MPENNISLNYNSTTGKLTDIHFKVYDTWATVPFEPDTKEFDETNSITKALREWEKSQGEPIDLSDRAPTQEPTNVTPVASNGEPTLDANIRNSVANEPQVVQERSPLLIDGLLAQGSFNRLGFPIWDPQTSRILPSKQGEIYLARVTVACTSAEPTVITIDLAVNGLIVYKESMQPTGLQNDLNIKTFPFFASANMRLHGAVLSIAASAPTELRNTSLYIVRLGG